MLGTRRMYVEQLWQVHMNNEKTNDHSKLVHMRVRNCVKQEKCGISTELCNAHLSNTSNCFTHSYSIAYQFGSTYYHSTIPIVLVICNTIDILFELLHENISVFAHLIFTHSKFIFQVCNNI